MPRPGKELNAPPTVNTKNPNMPPTIPHVPPTLCTLPPKTLLDIAKHSSTQDLLNLRAVCRYHCSVLTPVAFRLKRFSSITHYLGQASHPLSSPYLAQYVTEVDFRLDDSYLLDDNEYKRFLIKEWKILPVIEFPNLKSVHIILPQEQRRFRRYHHHFYCSEMQYLLLHWLSNSVTSLSPIFLTIGGLGLGKYCDLEPALKIVLEHTTRLQLRIYNPQGRWIYPGLQTLCDLWLNPAQRVERLELAFT